MPKGKSIRRRPQFARGLAVFLLAFGVAYFITLFYTDLPPAKLLLGMGTIAYFALVNGLIYGLAGWLIVTMLYRSK